MQEAPLPKVDGVSFSSQPASLPLHLFDSWNIRSFSPLPLPSDPFPGPQKLLPSPGLSVLRKPGRIEGYTEDVGRPPPPERGSCRPPPLRLESKSNCAKRRQA